MSSDRDDIIILIDENGNEVEAEFIDTIEYSGNEYVVLLPKEEHKHADADAGGGCDCEDEEEVVILKVEKGSDGNEESYVVIEDEGEQDAVFQIFSQRMEEVEFDEDEDDDDDFDEPDDFDEADEDDDVDTDKK